MGGVVQWWQVGATAWTPRRCCSSVSTIHVTNGVRNHKRAFPLSHTVVAGDVIERINLVSLTCYYEYSIQVVWQSEVPV